MQCNNLYLRATASSALQIDTRVEHLSVIQNMVIDTSKVGSGNRHMEVCNIEGYNKDPSTSFHTASSSNIFERKEDSRSTTNSSSPTNTLVSYLGGVSRGVALDAAQACQEIQLEIKERSHGLFDNTEHEDLDTLGRFALEEIVFGKTPLGSGGFSNVYEIKSFQPKSDQEVHITKSEKKARSFLAQHAQRDKTGDTRYAVKQLKPELMEDHSKFITGAKDIASEAELLSMLQHPNIIKMRGHSLSGTAGFGTGLNTGYVLILDRLNETLSQRLPKWKGKKRPLISKLKRFSNGGKKGVNDKGSRSCHDKTWEDRLYVAYEISAALLYLHRHNIIFRDLKPDNIGFDVRGDVKLFDFGFAKILPPRTTEDSHETFHLSIAGSLRYMANEVALGEPYNLKADVYSFTMVLWAILAMDTPFNGFNYTMFFDMYKEGSSAYRPTVDDKWPSGVKSLLKEGWSVNQNERPTIEQCFHTMRRDLATVRNESSSDLTHSRRRSTFVMRRSINLFSQRHTQENQIHA